MGAIFWGNALPKTHFNCNLERCVYSCKGTAHKNMWRCESHDVTMLRGNYEPPHHKYMPCVTDFSSTGNLCSPHLVEFAYICCKIYFQIG